MAKSTGAAILLNSDKLSEERALRFNRSAISYAVSGADAAIIVVAAVVSGLVYHYLAFEYIEQPMKYVAIGLVAAASFVLFMMASGYYRPSVIVYFKKQLLYVSISAVALVAFMAVIVFLLGVSDDFSRGTLLIFWGVAFTSIIVSRVFWARNIRVATSKGIVEKKKILLIGGAGASKDDFRDEMAAIGIEPTHVLQLAEDEMQEGWFTRAGSVATQNVSEIYLVAEGMAPRSIEALLFELRDLPLPVKLILDPFATKIAVLPSHSFGDRLAIELQRAPLTFVEYAIKRTFDIVVALLALIAFAPLMILVAIAIKIDSPGPVIFRQRRRGFNNVPFDILKFRSMSVMENGDSVTQAVQNDCRITRIGRFIRSTSIDELPQFLNVLFGQMSIVGPRPHAISQDDQYDQLIAKYAFRRHVKPGITGWAQVNGHRGETPTVSSMEQRLEHDLWYMHHWSVWLDTKIVAQTFASMFDRRSAF